MRKKKKEDGSTTVSVSVPQSLRRRMDGFRQKQYVNWSSVCAEAIRRFLDRYNKEGNGNGK